MCGEGKRHVTCHDPASRDAVRITGIWYQLKRVKAQHGIALGCTYCVNCGDAAHSSHFRMSDR